MPTDVYSGPGLSASAAAIVVHGGAWSHGSRHQMAPICGAIVKLAHLTCYAPDYTLDGVAPFPAANNDLLGLVDFVKAQGYRAVGAVGLSAGGTLVAWLANQGVLQTAVTWSAPTDLVHVCRQGWGCSDDQVMDYAPTLEDRREASPALHTSSVTCSLLIINSNAERIPLAQPRELVRNLVTPHLMQVLAAGRKHAFGYRAEATPLTVEWLARHTPSRTIRVLPWFSLGKAVLPS